MPSEGEKCKRAGLTIKRRQFYPDTFFQGFPFFTTCTICSHFNTFSLNCSYPLPANQSLETLPSMVQRCFSASSSVLTIHFALGWHSAKRLNPGCQSHFSRKRCGFVKISDGFVLFPSFFPSLARQKVGWSTCRFLPMSKRIKLVRFPCAYALCCCVCSIRTTFSFLTSTCLFCSAGTRVR